MLSNLALPFAFGLALPHVPLSVKVCMFAAGALNMGEHLFAFLAREKDAALRPSQPSPVQQVFTGDDARRLNDFVHNLANKPQRSDMQ